MEAVEGRTHLSAKDVLDRYWDRRVPVDVVAIARAMGAEIKEISPFDRLTGYICRQDNGGIEIGYKLTDPEVRQRFTVAHEIGHLALGHLTDQSERYRDDVASFFSGVKDPKEVAANKFAAALLMPKVAIDWVLANKPNIYSVEQMAEMFNVSSAAMGFRLDALGIRLG
ncbi:ImmA/IrrE family metallo-endopeptidase [Silvimonas soli]|uniref:ImmA/IrrE family metallo-endopeptidase n=1 Tax=Silvimonas soli TaxID=2980100 RepID=UPI0024B37DDF|nr:ImmA/IrrE family metallo-endopeptidase [Silvimonas soli]